MNYKSGLLAVLLYFNIITMNEYIGRDMHEWEIKNVYQRQQEVDDSGNAENTDEDEGDRADGVEDNSE